MSKWRWWLQGGDAGFADSSIETQLAEIAHTEAEQGVQLLLESFFYWRLSKAVSSDGSHLRRGVAQV